MSNFLHGGCSNDTLFVLLKATCLNFFQGVPYNSATFIAYLPYNQDGRTILTGFRKAFEDLRSFVVHRNGTRGLVTWADVEHKTSLEENNEFG